MVLKFNKLDNFEKLFGKSLIVISVIFMCIFADTQLIAQNDNSAFCIPHTIFPKDSNKLFLEIENANYFENLYYFNPYESGYKEIGYFVQPSLTYYPTGSSKLTAGLFALKYDGLDNYSNLQPVFSMQYRICPGLNMVLGTLYGTTNHQLIEPIFQFDRYITEHVENGLQFLLDTKNIRSDLWLNWEHFIFVHSPTQETFVVGNSTEIFLTGKECELDLKIPIQFLFAHRGGMNTDQTQPVQTLFNFVYGVEGLFKVNGSMFNSIGFKGYAAHYADLSVIQKTPFPNGFGLYPNFIMEGKHFEVMMGYWNATKFIAPRGEYLFQSISNLDSSYFHKRRQLQTCKLTYHFTITRGIELGTRFQYYYDLYRSNMDYTYSVYIVLNGDFFLMPVKHWMSEYRNEE